ncbi:MAG: fibronectin type III domain-containing protein [Spirochaetia bacterium]|nr:fibronectin type III domain-containing protein [Spirochaetia bacterium]
MKKYLYQIMFINLMLLHLLNCSNDTLNAPENIKVSQDGTPIKVEWDAVSGATAYAVSKKEANEAAFSTIYYADRLYYEDYNIISGYNYFYYVTAFSGDLESDPSETVNITAK